MPEYSYICEKCDTTFSIISSIKDYTEKVKCLVCNNMCCRNYAEDLANLSTSIKLANSELKTLGHLAQRNTETMSEDQKNELYRKHNSYKEVVSEKPLPKGMNRIKKPPKVKWTKDK